MGEPVQNENENHLIGNILAEDNSDSDLEDNKLTTSNNNGSGIPSQSASNGGGGLSGGGGVAGQNSQAFGSSSVTGKLGFGVTGGAFGLGANAPYGGAFTNSGIPDIVGSSSATDLSAKYYGHDSPQSKKLFGGGPTAGSQPSNLSFSNLFPGDLHYRSQQQQQQQQELMRRQSGLEFNLQPTTQPPQQQPAQSVQDQFIQSTSVAGAGQAVQDLANPASSATGGDILKTPFGQAVGGGSQQDIYRTKEYYDYYHSLKPRDPRLPSPTFRPIASSTTNQSSSGSNQETSSESNIKQQIPLQQVNNSTTSAASVTEVEQKMNQLNLIGDGTSGATGSSTAGVPSQMTQSNPMLGSQPGFIDPIFLQQFYQFQSQGMYNNFQMMQGHQQMQNNYTQQPSNHTVQVSGRGGKKNKKGVMEPPPMPKPEDSKKAQLTTGNNPNSQINRMQQPFQNMPGQMGTPQIPPGYSFPQQMLGQMFNNPQQQQSLFNNGDPSKVGQMQGNFGQNWNGALPLLGGIPFGNGVQPQPGQQQQSLSQYQNNSGQNQQPMFNTSAGGLMNPALFSNNDQQQMMMQNYFMQSQMVNKMMMQGGNNQPYPPGNQALGSNSNGFQGGYNYGQYGYNNSQQYGRGNGQGSQNNYNQDTYQKKNQRGGGSGNHGGSNRGQGGRGGGQYHIKGNHNRDANHQQQYYQQDRRGGGRAPQSQERDSRGQHIDYNQDIAGDQMPPMIVQQAKSEFLEDLRSKIQNGRKIEIKDIKDHVVECSMDQYGSRFIQQKYDVTTSEEKDLIFTEILPEAHSLMNDVFGNYVVQKLFEYGTELQRATLAEQLIGNVLKLTKSMYGCRVVQKALEVISLEQKKLLVLELKDSVLDCVYDQNGNHVIQKCIEKMPQDVDFIVQAVNDRSDTVKELCLHTYGCRVIQRILENCHEKQTKTIIDKILIDIQPLTKDQFGNYVIQHILENGKTQEDKNRIVRSIKGKVIEMSNHKFASNVVEKCLQHGSEKDKKDIIDEFLESNYELSEEINNLGGPQGLNGALYTMMKDRYGNYVIQKCIEVSKGKQREVLIKKITACANVLRKQANYSRHVYNFIEKFCGESEQPSMTTNQNNSQARFSDASQEQYRESYHNQGGSGGGGGGGHYNTNYHGHNYHNGGGYQNQHHYQSSSSHGGHHYVQKQKQGSSGGGGKKKM